MRHSVLLPLLFVATAPSLACAHFYTHCQTDQDVVEAVSLNGARDSVLQVRLADREQKGDEFEFIYDEADLQNAKVEELSAEDIVYRTVTEGGCVHWEQRSKVRVSFEVRESAKTKGIDAQLGIGLAGKAHSVALSCFTEYVSNACF